MDAKAAAEMLEGIRAQLERDEDEGKLEGMGVRDLADAIAHPKAAAVIGRMMELEARSVREGDPAPDFTLPWLAAAPAAAGPTFTLSEHVRRRPVALVFGSYT